MLSCLDFPSQRQTNGLEQFLVTERLAQEGDGTGLHPMPTGAFIVVCGDKNDGNAAAGSSHLALELQAIHAWQLHVNEEAGSILQFDRLQEILGRFKGCRSKAERLDEKLGCPADGLIVVDY